MYKIGVSFGFSFLSNYLINPFGMSTLKVAVFLLLSLLSSKPLQSQVNKIFIAPDLFEEAREACVYISNFDGNVLDVYWLEPEAISNNIEIDLLSLQKEEVVITILQRNGISYWRALVFPYPQSDTIQKKDILQLLDPKRIGRKEHKFTVKDLPDDFTFKKFPGAKAYLRFVKNFKSTDRESIYFKSTRGVGVRALITDSDGLNLWEAYVDPRGDEPVLESKYYQSFSGLMPVSTSVEIDIPRSISFFRFFAVTEDDKEYLLYRSNENTRQSSILLDLPAVESTMIKGEYTGYNVQGLNQITILEQYESIGEDLKIAPYNIPVFEIDEIGTKKSVVSYEHDCTYKFLQSHYFTVNRTRSNLRRNLSFEYSNRIWLIGDQFYEIGTPGFSYSIVGDSHLDGKMFQLIDFEKFLIETDPEILNIEEKAIAVRNIEWDCWEQDGRILLVKDAVDR